MKNILRFIIYIEYLKFGPISGCRIMVITRASQARDVSSILITRSIKLIKLNFYDAAISNNTILNF